MEAKAIANTVRVTPRKARLVVDAIRGKDTKEAFAILKYTNKNANEAVYKVLKSAVSNAEQKGMDVNNLYVKETFANDGIRMKRMLPRAKGRGDAIIKRTCNITIVVAEKE